MECLCVSPPAVACRHNLLLFVWRPCLQATAGGKRNFLFNAIELR
nr:MAG TPA: hypothetical protein [Caudoviricetes sp.]DAS98929.1 MAG TPA: hypothetical protein [Caudoviricetes sp.]